ncbi:hypothetical protein [Acinetobacter sp. Marseille-Q1618]|uniref:hypothetical protein n=1 Tax=Acinetobacter sp. Marseille-Q1618 TaxID=2697502 RepID=UPI00157055EC|nr:hypothetical protein [Acinetobacter sp. Marseille-Q1618]
MPDRYDPLIDYEWGGVDLLDTSQGLQVKIWTCFYDGNWICVQSGDILHRLIQVEHVTALSLAFDFNMHPTIAYISDFKMYLYWYDTAQGKQITTEYGLDYLNPQLSLDDHRLHQSGNADIIFAYLKNGNLYYRQQRDRFLIERLLQQDIEVELKQIGMNNKNRFQFVFW